jgi:hypothetical protein
LVGHVLRVFDVQKNVICDIIKANLTVTKTLKSPWNSCDM